MSSALTTEQPSSALPPPAVGGSSGSCPGPGAGAGAGAMGQVSGGGPAAPAEAPTLLVTGATGTTGYETLQVLASEHPKRFKVIAGVHGAIPEAVLRAVDVARHIDADDTRALNFAGVDSLFIIPSNAEARVEQVRNYVEAARRAGGVRHILLLSVLSMPDAPRDHLFARQFAEMEACVNESGISCTFLRCTFYQQNLFAHADEIRASRCISLPIRRGKCAPLNVHDVARAAVAILANPGQHARKAYDLVGPQLLDGQGIAEAASRGLGRTITFNDCSRDEFLDLYRRQGVPGWLANGFAELLELVAANRLANFETRSFFVELTGREPITLEQFFRDNADRFSHEYVAAAAEREQRERERERRGAGPSEFTSFIEYGAKGGGEFQPVGDQLVVLLRDLVAEKYRRIKAKRENLRREEARLDQLIDNYERFERAMARAASAMRAPPPQPSGRTYAARYYESESPPELPPRPAGYGGPRTSEPQLRTYAIDRERERDREERTAVPEREREREEYRTPAPPQQPTRPRYYSPGVVRLERVPWSTTEPAGPARDRDRDRDREQTRPAPQTSSYYYYQDEPRRTFSYSRGPAWYQ